jgi:hypothetical protein
MGNSDALPHHKEAIMWLRFMNVRQIIAAILAFIISTSILHAGVIPGRWE